MQLLALSEKSAELSGSHRFVVNLIAPKGGPVLVRSCEVIGANFRNRFSFPARVSISEVFVEKMARSVMSCVSSLSRKTEVMSLPDTTIELPRLTLSKVHVVSNLSEDGQLDVILRFKTLLGGVSKAFQPDLGIVDSVPDYSTHMSALVLTDIVMPLLDMCAIAEGDEGLPSAEAFDTFMATLVDRSREVRFQAELIKRFVNSAAAPDAKLQHISTSQQSRRLASLI